MELTEFDIDLLQNCKICPRQCGINRFEQPGACGADADIIVSSVNLHHGEEPPISGYNGSGTIFLSHCNLHCVYCQNYPISQQGVGNRYSIEKLVDAMFSLERRGAHNINFVSPSHYAIQIRRAIIIARDMGLNIPIVYNTSGYDSPDTLALLDGLIDIYMPDIRYWENAKSKKYSDAENYPDVAKKAVKIMHDQTGFLHLDDDGIATRGVLIRLLVLPGNISSTTQTLNWIAEYLGTNTYLSVMSQYFPAYKAFEFPPLDRKITGKEYLSVLDKLDETGFERGYIQPVP